MTVLWRKLFSQCQLVYRLLICRKISRNLELGEWWGSSSLSLLAIGLLQTSSVLPVSSCRSQISCYPLEVVCPSRGRHADASLVGPCSPIKKLFDPLSVHYSGKVAVLHFCLAIICMISSTPVHQSISSFITRSLRVRPIIDRSIRLCVILKFFSGGLLLR